MSLLYIVAESGADAAFYALCAARITGREFTPIPLENRRADGVERVKLQLKYALKQARGAASGGQSVCFIAAMDNDRAPHPENAALDRKKLSRKDRDESNRAEWMRELVASVLGQNTNAWPLPVAIAVPVEMLEAWVYRAVSPTDPQPMPLFARADSESARAYYSQSATPPQWKDIVAEKQSQMGISDKRAFQEMAARELDAVALAARSLSFRMFKEWLDQWPKAAEGE